MVLAIILLNDNGLQELSNKQMVFYNLLELCVDVVRGNNFEYESHTSIEHLWRRQLSVLNTNEEVYEGEWKRNLMQHSIAEIMIEVWNHKAPE